MASWENFASAAGACRDGKTTVVVGTEGDRVAVPGARGRSHCESSLSTYRETFQGLEHLPGKRSGRGLRYGKRETRG